MKGLTFQSGEDTAVRGAFQNNGTLGNKNDTNFRAIDDDYPVFGFAVDLGAIGSASAGIGATDSVSTLFTLGLTQELAAQFVGESGTTVAQVPSLWTSYFATELAAVSIQRIMNYQYTECNRSRSSTTTIALLADLQPHLTIWCPVTP